MRIVTNIFRHTGVLALALLLGCGASAEKQPAATASQSGEAQAAEATPESAAMAQAPDFSLTRVDADAQISLAALKGKVVIVDFWATWCPPCVGEIPDFIDLYMTYKDQGFEMVGISVDQGGPGVVKQFMEKHGVNYPVVMASMDVVNAYEVFTGIPTTFVIDRQGKIVDKVIGAHPKEYFENHIKKLL